MRTSDQTPDPGVSRFAGTLLDLLDRVQYRRVLGDADTDPVYRLRYEAYRREAFVPVSSQRTTRDIFDDAPNCYCFGVYIDDQLVSSIRFHHVTATARISPCMSVWPDLLGPEIDAGNSFIDPGRFTADFEASLAYPALPYLTLRVAAMACEYFPVKYCTSAIRPEHAAFYRRVFSAHQFGDERRYADLDFPMRLYVADVPVIRDALMRRFPFFLSTHDERDALFGTAGMTPAIAPSARQAQRLEELQKAS